MLWKCQMVQLSSDLGAKTCVFWRHNPETWLPAVLVTAKLPPKPASHKMSDKMAGMIPCSLNSVSLRCASRSCIRSVVRAFPGHFPSCLGMDRSCWFLLCSLYQADCAQLCCQQSSSPYASKLWNSWLCCGCLVFIRIQKTIGKVHRRSIHSRLLSREVKLWLRKH